MWYKGQIHCHTTNSDGKTFPGGVAKYYKKLGFNFLCITDHNYLTMPENDPFWGIDENFICIPSCEYTGGRCCHVVGLDVSETVKPNDFREQEKWSKKDILQEGVDRVCNAGGLPILCHPDLPDLPGLDLPEVTPEDDDEKLIDVPSHKRKKSPVTKDAFKLTLSA